MENENLIKIWHPLNSVCFPVAWDTKIPVRGGNRLIHIVRKTLLFKNQKVRFIHSHALFVN